MIESISTAFIAGKVITFLATKFAGKTIDKWLSVRKKKKAFEKALEQALIKVAEAEFTIRGPGGLNESFLINEVVTEELWTKLLDPTIDEEIDYKLLEKALRDLYTQVKIGDKEREAIEFFVDALIDQMWSQDALRDILTTKIIRQHDLKLSLAKKKALVRDYLQAVGQRIKCELDEEIGEGNRYVEPLIEKREKKKEREEKRIKERFPPEEADSFTPVDMNTYFVESSDSKVIVVADSGYGKTTLLKELLVRISDMFHAKTFRVDTPIPIYFTPSQAADCSEGNIINIVTGRLMDSGCRESKVRQFVQDQFHMHTGGFIFLIDALDQVSSRQNLLGALEGRCFRENRVVATTRPNVYDMEKGHLGNYVYLRIREFDEDRWEEYLGKEKLEALREIVDEEFLSVPILLKLVLEFWLGQDEKMEPVKNRADLYSQMFDKLLKRQPHIDSAKQRPLSNIKNDLCILAHDTLVKGYLGQFPRDEVRDKILNEDRLNDLEARRWIFETARKGEELAFRHRSFQEYLAAEYLNSFIKTENDLDKLESYLYHPNWEESLRFLAGLLSSKLAEKVVDRILNQAEGKPLFLYRDHLRLAALCLREIGETGQNQRKEVVDLLKSDIGNYILRSTAISTLIVLRGEESVEILEGLLSHKNSSVRVRAAEILGEIKCEKSLEILIKCLKDEDTYVRGSAVYALGELKSEKVIKYLIQALKDKADGVRFDAVSALSYFKSEKVVESLIQALHDEYSFVREISAAALGMIESDNVVEPLIQALLDKDYYVRRNAASSLGNLKSEKAVDLLIKSMMSMDSDVLYIAARAYVKIKSKKMVNFLMKAINGKNSFARRNAVYTLIDLKSDPLVETLIESTKDKQSDVRQSAVDALGAIKSEAAVESLIQALKDEDSSVRWRAAKGLAGIKSDIVVASLIQALKDEDSVVRERAVSALGEIKSKVAVGPLIQALKDEDYLVRRNSAEALGEIRSGVAVASLIQVLKDEDSDVRWRAASALGKIKSEKAVESLIQVLKDEDSDVRWSAANALGEIKSEIAVESLIQVLKDEDFSVRGKAASALGEIGTSGVLAKLMALWNTKDPKADRANLLHTIKKCDRKVRSQQPIKPISREFF
ncbi:MAG: HEAT repeat domain-containing protein [Candidatus Zixiibacteriota bacterium]